MNTPLRASLFALARDIDWARDRVAFIDWTKPQRARACDITLAENATLNLFLTPQTCRNAEANHGLPEDSLGDHVRVLREKGLLLSEDDWQAERANHPYVNLPSPKLESLSGGEHFANYEEAYARGAVPWSTLPVATDMLSLTPLPDGRRKRLLDVGCGSGHNLALMQRLGFDCAGIDVSQTAVAAAKRGAQYPEAFVAGSVTNLPWPDRSFDIITDIGCLHCLEPDEIAPYIAELARVLAPAGRFFCRSFKPRDEAVVAAQPVKMERLGFEPDEIRTLFAEMLPVVLIKEGPVYSFFLGRALD